MIGSLNWCARECRPDAAAAASLGAASFPAPTIQDILDVNRAVETVKSRPELSIKIQPIPVKDLCWGVISDASFANAHSGGSQGAYGILAYHKGLHDGERVDCSLISWKSGRIQKVVNSTLAPETQSLSKVVSFTDLLLLFFRGLCVPFPARIVLVVVFWTVLWNSVGLFWGSAFLPCGFEATALFFEFVPCKIAKANLAFEWKN